MCGSTGRITQNPNKSEPQGEKRRKKAPNEYAKICKAMSISPLFHSQCSSITWHRHSLATIQLARRNQVKHANHTRAPLPPIQCTQSQCIRDTNCKFFLYLLNLVFLPFNRFPHFSMTIHRIWCTKEARNGPPDQNDNDRNRERPIYRVSIVSTSAVGRKCFFHQFAGTFMQARSLLH